MTESRQLSLSQKVLALHRAHTGDQSEDRALKQTQSSFHANQFAFEDFGKIGDIFFWVSSVQQEGSRDVRKLSLNCLSASRSIN